MLMVHVWLALKIALPAIRLDQDTVTWVDAHQDILGLELINAHNAFLDALFALPPTSAPALHARLEHTLPAMSASFAQLGARLAPAHLSAPLALRATNSQEAAV